MDRSDETESKDYNISVTNIEKQSRIALGQITHWNDRPSDLALGTPDIRLDFRTDAKTRNHETIATRLRAGDARRELTDRGNAVTWSREWTRAYLESALQSWLQVSSRRLIDQSGQRDFYSRLVNRERRERRVEWFSCRLFSWWWSTFYLYKFIYAYVSLYSVFSWSERVSFKHLRQIPLSNLHIRYIWKYLISYLTS